MRNFSVFAVVAAALVIAGGARAQTCTNFSTDILDPPVFQWTDNGSYKSGTLEVGEATFCIGGETLTTRAYRQYVKGQSTPFSIPGPTLNMVPGEKYVVTFKNSLPYEVPSTEHNVFKDANISNLHTHGFHISGETPADDVTRVINGGQCGDYVYDVLPDHMGGTLWYHAHHHGSTFLQVAGGAFGLLIIDDSGDNIPPAVAGMSERPLAIAYLDPAAQGTGGDTLMTGTLSATWTVNGVVDGNFTMTLGEWEHWRVLLADRDAKEKTLSVGASCEVELLARDGVWRSTAPKTLAANQIDLTGASRADLAVKCSAGSTINVNGTAVATVNVDSSVAPNTDVGPYDPANTVDGTWSAKRPAYLRDLRNEPVAASETINMGARTVNGSKFDIDVPTFLVDQIGVQEWQVKGATNHPFHLHVYHMQMQDACGSYEAGEYYDTIAASGCYVRFDADPVTSTVYKGRTIMHCHILAHEDQGAMGWVNVLAGLAPPSFPDPTQQELYECGTSGPSCTPTETTETSCSDGLDNDCDGLIDAADSDCAAPPPPADCSTFNSAKTCNAEPLCSWSGKNKSCTAL